MADDLAELGDGLAQLLDQARLMDRAHRDAVAINRPVHEAIVAIERLAIAADFIRSLYDQPLPGSAPLSNQEPPPMPHERAAFNPALQDALRRDET